MSALLQQAVLAFGMGGIVALAGQGVVQIYRGSGVLNFAHGAFALASAQVFAWAWADHHWPLPLAIAAAVVVGALLGLLTQVLVMRPLRDASQLVQIIATIGVLQVVQQGSQMIFGNQPRQVGSFLPRGALSIGSTKIQKGALVILGVAIAATIILAVVMNITRFGLATRAVAQSELASRSLGWSPDLVASGSWAIGGALAGLAGTFIVPIGGVAIGSILLLAVPAFAAAVLGGFQSYAVTTIGAVAIASGQAILTFQAVGHGWPASLPAALPFLVVVLVLVVRSRSLPARDHVVAHLPRLGLGRPPKWIGAVLVGFAAVALAAPVNLANALITTMVTAIIGLSLVVCTGLTGQISLAQYAIAGIGALVAARVSDGRGWPFFACMALGVLAAAVLGALFALPAIRTRGPSLAVVTIGLGLGVQQGILADKDITGGFNGATPVKRPSLFGLHIDATTQPARYAAVCIVIFGLLGIAVAGLARSSIGRRMIAVRNNERAAAAMGIRVGRVKVYGFAVASAIAGFGGVLVAFRFDAVQYSQFTFAASLQIVTFVLIGGIGFVYGPLAGAIAVPAGIVAWAVADLGNVASWLIFLSGVTLIITLIKAPDGAVAMFRRPGRHGKDHRPDDPSNQPRAWPAETLVLEGLSVRFGDVMALDGVSLVVQPGRVTGLIGANGAGKTTLIDGVSGFVPTAAGVMRLGDLELNGLSAADRAARGVARCFQSIDLFHDLTVRQNLLVASEEPRMTELLSVFVAPGDNHLPAEARWVAEQLDLVNLLDQWPETLSHGQRRLVGVARALVGRPAVLLLDEPAAGLDKDETELLGDVIRHVADLGMGILLVEHDVDFVLRVSDHVVAIDTGRPIYDGPPSGVLADVHVRRSYLGEADGPDVATELDVDATAVGS